MAGERHQILVDVRIVLVVRPGAEGLDWRVDEPLILRRENLFIWRREAAGDLRRIGHRDCFGDADHR